MHKNIFIIFPFDPNESIPPSIMFKSVNIHLDTSHYLLIELYSSVIVLDCTTKGGKLLDEMPVAKWVDITVNLGCHDHFQNHLSELYYPNLSNMFKLRMNSDLRGLL